MKEILGSTSAYAVAKEAGRNNMQISAPFIIEVLDRIAELEEEKIKTKDYMVTLSRTITEQAGDL